MLLVLDIGNTNITIGLFNTKNGKSIANPINVWRMSTIKGQTADEYASNLLGMFHYSDFNVADIKHIAVASVVPSLNRVFEELADKYMKKKIFFVNYVNNGGLKFSVKNYKEVGADRIANAVAAYNLFGGGSVVIDFGTATTFDCIDLKGTYMGGAIALGPALAAQALSLKTAQLPHVEMKKPPKAIGTTTAECIQGGLYFGYIGLIKELIERTKKEMKVKHIIATGGLAQQLSKEIKEIEKFVPDLTLEGIRQIWEKSK